jgi:flavin-dependent dehydrogenase
VRRIEGVRLYAPNLRSVDLFAPGYYFWANRCAAPAGLDGRFGALARRAGAAGEPLYRSAPDRRALGGATGDGETVRSRYLVGADGPHSRVAKALGLSRNQHFLFGLEHEYAGAAMEPNLLHCFIDRRLAPGYIGWAFAGVNVAQVGLARRMSPQGRPKGEYRSAQHGGYA